MSNLETTVRTSIDYEKDHIAIRIKVAVNTDDDENLYNHDENLYNHDSDSVIIHREDLLYFLFPEGVPK